MCTFKAIQNEALVLLVIRNVIIKPQISLMAHWQPVQQHCQSQPHQPNWLSMVQGTNSAAQRSTAQHSAAQRSTAQHSAAQRSTAQHSAAQRSTAQYSTAQDRQLQGHALHVLEAAEGSGPRLVCVGNTACKGVLQVQAAVYPEGSGLWLALPPHHLALHSHVGFQLC